MLKEAEVPMPSANPALLPAIVAVVPSWYIRFTTCNKLSVMMISLPLIDIPNGSPKSAGLPKVDTTAEGVIRRMTRWTYSVTYKSPRLSMAIPRGFEKPAAVPIPSAREIAPLPAKVVVTPDFVT